MPIIRTGTAEVGLLKISRALIPLVLLMAVLAGCTLPPIISTPSSPAARVPTVDATGVTDVSDQMAAFIASVPNGSTISLVTNGRYRMEKTLLIDHRRDLTIEGNGATFLLTTPGDTNRSNVRLHYSSGITVRNLKVVGSNPMAGAKDRVYHAERGGQHGFDLESSSNVKLIGVTGHGRLRRLRLHGSRRRRAVHDRRHHPGRQLLPQRSSGHHAHGGEERVVENVDDQPSQAVVLRLRALGRRQLDGAERDAPQQPGDQWRPPLRLRRRDVARRATWS